jgi:hypothetical protein
MRSDFRVQRAMFRVSVKHAMFDLQDVLLMCWINHLNWRTKRQPLFARIEHLIDQVRLRAIVTLRERVRLVNGTIAIDSKPMSGTRIHVRVPLESEHDNKRAAG